MYHNKDKESVESHEHQYPEGTWPFKIYIFAERVMLHKLPTHEIVEINLISNKIAYSHPFGNR